MLGSLHLDTDDEPRRGASRANSVRFDESAMQGHFGQASRSSTDFLPQRTGSAYGSHPMTERSSSHRSEGRQSSTHSARASSFGFESRPLSATVAPFVPLGPPPGLFILGPVPSIIRCWLDTNFSNESLLYAVVCTGSYKSTVDFGLISRLGYQAQITTGRDGQRVIKLPVYLPEATIQQSSARSVSPAPTLPTLTTTFVVPDTQCKEDAIQIFIGCDVLRTRNADIHFSLDRLTLFDDDRNKLSVPLVRPENAVLFQNLQTSASDSLVESSVADESGHNRDFAKSNGKAKEPNPKLSAIDPDDQIEESKPLTTTGLRGPSATPSPSVIGEGRKTSVVSNTSEVTSSTKASIDLQDSESLANGTTASTPLRTDSGNVWGPSGGAWRREPTTGIRTDPAANSTASGYQRPSRGRGMKVLKPLRANAPRTSSAQQPVGFDAAPSRFGDTSRPGGNDENQRTDTERRSFSSEPKPLSGSKPRASNPVGGASAFPWLNAGQQKSSGPTD